jgi:hypothetical protein
LREPLPVEVERDLVFFNRVLREAIFLPKIPGATNVSLYSRSTHFDKHISTPAGFVTARCSATQTNSPMLKLKSTKLTRNALA